MVKKSAVVALQSTKLVRWRSVLLVAVAAAVVVMADLVVVAVVVVAVVMIVADLVAITKTLTKTDSVCFRQS